jgi:hypothetical protein
MNALLAAHATLGGPTLSRRQYDDWYAAQTHEDGLSPWPSSGYIRAAFHGSWSPAVESVGLQPSLAALRRRYMRLHRPTAEALIAGLRAAAAAYRQRSISYKRYRALVVAFLQCGGVVPAANSAGTGGAAVAVSANAIDVTADAGDAADARTPLGLFCEAAAAADAAGQPFAVARIATFQRRFGSWSDSLWRADLLDESSSAVGVGRPRGNEYDYSRPGLLDGIQTAARALKVRRLQATKYDAWAQKTSGENRAKGIRRVYARAGAIYSEFGPWPNALHAAGLISDEELEWMTRGDARVRPDSALVDDLIHVALTLGQVPSGTEYTRFRSDPQRRLLPDGTRICCGALFDRRFGGIRNAVELAKKRSAAFAALPDPQGEGRRYRRVIPREQTIRASDRAAR